MEEKNTEVNTTTNISAEAIPANFKAPVIPGKRKSMVVRIVLAIIVLAIVFFGCLRIFAGSWWPFVKIDTRQPAFNVNLDKVNFAVATDPRSSKNISAADKRAIYESLLAGFKTMISGDAVSIRAYLSAKDTTPAEKKLTSSLSDADIISLSKRLSAMMIMPVPDLLLASTSVWSKNGNVVTIEYADPNTGTTTKKATYIDGKYY